MLKTLDFLSAHVSKRFIQTSVTYFKGHAKWQNIKHIKAANDQQRGLMILKQMRMLRIASIEGGSPNPDINPVLRSAIEEARRRDVPNTTIKNFLKKISEAKDKANYQRQLFEGRLYKKLYFIASVYTDSVAHTRIQMATPYKKHLAENTNTKRLFIERGVCNVIARDGISADNFEDECLNDAIECGAEDIEVYDVAERQVTFFCDPRELLQVRHKLTAAGHKIEQSELVFCPNPSTQLVQLSDAELADYRKFKDRLTLVEGFDGIYDNAENDDDNS